jgi:GDPmannose 4,6-dehydratase
MGALGIIEALRDWGAPVRLYHASTSEIFGAPEISPQNEGTPMRPINPYGCAKAFATQLCKVYREAYGMYICNGIAYNHESPRRGENFVTRKIAMAAARFARGERSVLRLGDLDARRDWGYAAEYIVAMWRSLQEPASGDYILATGQTSSVREFAVSAFSAIDIELVFEGRGIDEVGRCRKSGALVIEIDPRYYRLSDSSSLVGDPSYVHRVLGWKARTSGIEVARLMTRAECGL